MKHFKQKKIIGHTERKEIENRSQFGAEESWVDALTAVDASNYHELIFILLSGSTLTVK
jgi:hypothetical protein